MADFNLVPASYQQRLLRWRLQRMAAVAVGVLVLLSVGAYAALAQWSNNLADEVARLQQEQAVSARQSSLIAELNARKLELDQQWHLLESLRSGMPAKEMMEAVQSALRGNEVWFLDWRLRRAGIVTEKETAPNQPGYFIIVKQPGDDEDWRAATHMTIAGQAWDHSKLSDFAQRLLQHPQIQDVRVQRTSQTIGRDRQAAAVNFDLAVVFRSSRAPG